MTHEIQQYGSRMNGGASSPAVAEPIAAPAARYSLAELEQIAEYVVRSTMFAGIKTPQQAMTLMLLCEADGLHPMHAVRRYHVVPGRPPQMKADVLLAEFQKAGGKVEWHERSETRVDAAFSHPTYHPKPVRIAWSIEDAKRAGVAQSNPNYQRYPRQMLTARVIGEGVRLVCPGVTNGIYTPEEMDDATTVTVLESTPPPAPAAPTPVPAPPSAKPVTTRANAVPADTWENYIRVRLKAANEAWWARLAERGLSEADAGEHGTVAKGSTLPRIINSIVTSAIEAGLIPQSAVGKDEDPNTRDADKAKKAVRGLYEVDAATVRGLVEAWVAKWTAEAETALGWTAETDADSDDETHLGLPGDLDARAEFGPGADG